MATGASDTVDCGVIVVTYHARQHLRRCLTPLLASPLLPRVLVVNSGGGDGTLELAREMGAETLLVARDEFNHGLTRERARRHLGAAVTVFMTPDAYAADAGFLERLIRPLRDGEAEIAYGRQMARPDADLLERCAREFNYPRHSHVRRQADWPAFGSYIHFCSNACAAWSTSALDRIGGFRAGLVSEETVATAEILPRGGRIAYVAEAVVEHSHRQGPVDLFKRQFDVGYTRSQSRSLLLDRERDEVRGARFAATLLRRAGRDSPAAIPALTMRLAAMWLGYRAGRLGPRLPAAVARRLSGQDYYWTSAARSGGETALAVTA